MLEEHEDYETLATLKHEKREGQYHIFLKSQPRQEDALNPESLVFEKHETYPPAVWRTILCNKLGMQEQAVIEAITATR